VLRSLFRTASVQSLASLLLAFGSLLAGAALAMHHPLWPMGASIAFWLACISFTWRPGLWLFLVPALLPVLNFSPWTGWIVFEELDILLLAALVGGYLHRSGSIGLLLSPRRYGGVPWLMVVLLGGSGLLSLMRGFADAGGFSFDWFASYTDPLNSLRVFKSLAFSLLLWPLLGRELDQSSARSLKRFTWGVLTGLAFVTMAVVWERMAFPGLFNFSSPYRTVALFWEMHVGGGAIDAYLALTTPFVVWALLSSTRPLEWLAAAALALLTGYACLTTFSRGVYLAVGSSLLVLYFLLAIQRRSVDPTGSWWLVWRGNLRRHWRARAGLILVFALLIEVAAVLGGGSFMKDRLDQVSPDFGSRVEHWQQGLGFLSEPSDWWLGKGLGRAPTHFSQAGPKSEVSGSVSFTRESLRNGVVNSFVVVAGPPTRQRLGGGYALTQRVDPMPAGTMFVNFDVRATRRAEVYIDLCQRHLLYDRLCQGAALTVQPNASGWQPVSLALRGPNLVSRDDYFARPQVLTFSVVNAGGVAEFDNITLKGRAGGNILSNSNFSAAGAHWLPSAQSYFLPWHLDNLFIEYLVEWGASGLLLFLSLLAFSVWNLLIGAGSRLSLSPFFAASLFSVMAVGAVSSVIDAPRVALLLYLIVFCSSLATKEDGAR
jgi:hypothetical protein